jgi:ATP-binding cassette subfamily B (MDR/TAP) protein 1
MWGVLFGETIDLLFRRVQLCDDTEGIYPAGVDDCQLYWDTEADSMQERSYEISGYWIVVVAGCMLGNILTYYGFGMASERLNKRVRDTSFTALLRQEVSFFDKRSVGSITAQLQDDAARIQAFSGEPVRSMIVALSSVVTGVVISLIVSDGKPVVLLSLEQSRSHLHYFSSLYHSSCGRLLSSRSRVSRSWVLPHLCA